MSRFWREQKGAALVEYALVLPMLLLLFLGTLEIFRLISVRQSLRSGLKQALPCYTHWKDYAYRVALPECGTPDAFVRNELARNPFTIQLSRLEIAPNFATLNGIEYGVPFEVVVEADVRLGFLYPLTGETTITLRESEQTFMDVSPTFLQLNVQTPFPIDPGGY